MKTKLFFFFLTVCSSSLLFSQTENRATLSHTFYENSSNNLFSDVEQSNLDFSYFLKSKMIAKKIKWDNNVSLRTVMLDSNFLANLYDVAYVSSFVYTKNAKNFVIGNVRLNVRNQFDNDLSIDAIYPAISFGYMRQSQTNKSIRWAAGINYNNDFGKNVVLPFFIFNYEKPTLKFNATLPNSILLLVRNNPKFYYGINATLNAAIFDVQDTFYNRFQLLNANVFAFSQIKLVKKLWLEVKPGFTIRRDFNFLNTNFDSTSTEGKNILGNNFVLTTGLMYRMQ